MAKIDVTLLRTQAINGAQRADIVRRDPAVIHALNTFRSDAQQTWSNARRTLDSGGDLLGVVRGAWVAAGAPRAMGAIDPS